MSSRGVSSALLLLLTGAVLSVLPSGGADAAKRFEVNSRSVIYEELDGAPGGLVAILLPGTSGPAAPYYQQRAKALQQGGFTVLILHYFDATTPSQAPSNAN